MIVMEILILNTKGGNLSLIMLDFVVKVKKEYYPQTLLEVWKYEKRTKMENFVIDELEASSSDYETVWLVSSDFDNDETESDNKKDNNQSNE